MEENRVLFGGIMSALVSCIDEEENVREDDMRRLMRWHLSEGFTGFYLTGGTGEGPVLQKETRKKIVEIAKDEIGDKGKLIVHVGAIDLRTAVELAEHAAKGGAVAFEQIARRRRIACRQARVPCAHRWRRVLRLEAVCGIQGTSASCAAAACKARCRGRT